MCFDEELFGISITVRSKLSQSLALFFDPTDTTWECPSCKRVTKSRQEISPILLPNTLVLHIKRFKCTQNQVSKLTQRVDFPTSILSLQNTSYVLSSVINHHGSLKSGHYSAYVKHQNQWYCFNDRVVTPIETADIVSEHAYILFFTKS